MTPQEIFDKVATHLSNQGHRAISEDGKHCFYLMPNGDKCAFGCLIPENEYEPRFETHDVVGVLRNMIDPFHYPVLNSFKGHEDLLLSLQNAHDSDYSEHPIENRLIVVASNFNLDARIIDTLPWPKEWK